MILKEITIQKYRNFSNPQVVQIEEDVTGLVGKNESGKTTLLKALHRLNPANGSETAFDVTTEYPRWRLAPDRRKANLGDVRPIRASFQLEETDRAHIEKIDGPALPESTLVHFSRDYDHELYAELELPVRETIVACAQSVGLEEADRLKLLQSDTLADAILEAKTTSTAVKKDGETERGKALTSFARECKKLEDLMPDSMGEELTQLLTSLMPRFFYFSDYDRLPGETDLNELADKVASDSALTPSERTVLALLAHAGETPADFLDEDYNSRKAELQAASVDLSGRVFEYWRQNTDLNVIFDTDMPVVGKDPQGKEIRHRFLKIELRDDRHGGVETNFNSRSTGFQWFFSFFAAFSEFQDSDDPIIVLLDEPGTSLHGEAQKDFVRFVFEELGSSKQTMYTTHSQFMIDPGRYEKLRAVHDKATRENPDLGVEVGPVSLSADRDTVLPVESALGYSISQHLFLGSGRHLAVEGSSDFVYLQRFSDHMASIGEAGLSSKYSIIPVGGDSNMPAFVAILGRRLSVTALVDGDRTSAKLAKIKRAAAANGVPEDSIVVCSDLDGMPQNADIEDLFSAVDYLKLYNWAFDKSVTAADLAQGDQPIIKKLNDLAGSKFDHALPAHALTNNRADFFDAVSEETIKNFKAMIFRLNQIVD